MLRVLLVDDEPFIAQGLTVLIDWKKEGYEIAEIASNGKEALDYLKENRVDLILADIKMPIMTGIELLECIRRDNISDAYFVILSGYSDFSYAQKAIRYRCTDYILKPVEKEELVAILRKVSNISESSKKDEQHTQKLERAYLERNLIALLYGKYDGQNLAYVKEHMSISEGVRFIDIEIADEMNEEEREDGLLRAQQRKLYQACQEILAADKQHAIFDVSADEKSYDVGFIYCDYMAERMQCTEDAFLKQMQERLELTMQMPVQMMVGKKVPTMEGLPKSFGTACILKSLEAFHEKKSIYFYEDEVQVSQGGIVLCKNSLDALITAIEQNEKIEIRKSVEQLYEEMKQLGVAKDTVNLNINYLLFQLIHLATEQDDEVNQEEILHYISENSFEEGILRGSSIHLARFASSFADYLTQLRKNMSRGVLLEIEREIKENYSDNLSLRELSRKYFINSSYLGQIFRKKFGQSFKDYLCGYRINEAARQLVKTDAKINQIAENVGYKDSDYFIRKFIEIKGCTPYKYRKNRTVDDD